MSQKIVTVFDFLHTTKGLIGFKVENSGNFYKLLKKGSHLNKDNMSNKKDALLFSLLLKKNLNKGIANSIDLFSNEFCRLNKIEPERLKKLSNQLDFHLVKLYDGGFWFCQNHFPINGIYNFSPRNFKDEQFRDLANQREKNFDYLKRRKYNLIKEFSDEHKLDINFTDDDIPKKYIFHVEHTFTKKKIIKNNVDNKIEPEKK
ncbi:hypothetical protein DDB_G0279787 [Dictyostelium discoideum AX4]|uniref:Uncharacterized protein n=1 Tax=Dictyostelium discoideum TaxID=44689 RepID=Q54WC6_DICDI|nr:hypothetical protein DDB_G0279787 [Dictyostelium discoideum AX4]EAL67573.1 hypothetical protein DDB_G0279787 [Dictyostelium discoideum AX4]|eukprot:XP_641532.1 hypothetical protein DDB_G0279787 [Dictyostelium discoideum AX4]